MGNFGRVICVALPFLMTLAALAALLAGGLAGIADKSLYMFQVNTTDLSISPLDAANVFNIDEINLDPGSIVTQVASAIPSATNILNTFNSRSDAAVEPAAPVPAFIPAPAVVARQDSQTTNITAEVLGLYDLYDVSLWGYCYTPQNGSRECTKPAMNWAEGSLNSTANDFDSFLTLTGTNVTLPKEVKEAIQAFVTVSRWTQIVFIIACVALGVELVFGLLANCSRVFSCITWIVATFAAVAVCTAAGLATATAVVVVGAVEASAEIYGVTGSFNNRFLAAVWLAAAFALGAAFFWLFTICCCAPDRSSGKRSSRHADEGEKLMQQGPYQPIPSPGFPATSPGYAPQSYGGAPRRDLAYEPYSHARV